MKKSIRFIAVNAIIAAVYAALTVAVAPLSYGDIQFRFSEILVFLAFYDARFIPGLVLGCFIANLFSPMLVYDITFGTGATVIALLGIWFVGRTVKNRNVSRFIVPFIGAIANGLLVGLALYLAYQLPYWLTAAQVAIGEFAVLLLGAFIFMGIEKVPVIRRLLYWSWDDRKSNSKKEKQEKGS